MSDPVIIENEDESLVIIVDQGVPTIVSAAQEDSIVVTALLPSYALPVVDGVVIVHTDLPVATILTATGGGGGGSGYREIINYDGGKPDTLYGDYPHLIGGGVDDPFYYRLGA